MGITVVDHPLGRHYLSILRDASTGTEEFARATRRLTRILVVEATSGLPLDEYRLRTPLAPATGYRPARSVVAVAVIRAGLGMLEAVTEVVPDVAVGYVVIQRDEETARPEEYYTKLPEVTGRAVLVLEPMLATGGSLGRAVDLVKEAGATDITALCAVAAPEGVASMERAHPDVRVVVAAVDSHLDHRHYIVPGLGDMGDRLFGTP